MTRSITIRGVTLAVEACRYDGDYLYGPTLDLTVDPVAGRRVWLRLNAWHDKQGGAWANERDQHSLGVTASVVVSDARADLPAGIPF